jgi:hypothetical protein
MPGCCLQSDTLNDGYPMNLLDFFPPGAIQDIGRISINAGGVRFAFLSAIDALLYTRLGDQGIGRLSLRDQPFERICTALHRIAAVRGLPASALSEIEAFRSKYTDAMSDAFRACNGMWTYLGGSGSETMLGLFRDEIVRDSDLFPDWRILSATNIHELAVTMEAAKTAASAILRLVQFRSPKGSEGRPPEQ